MGTIEVRNESALLDLDTTVSLGEKPILRKSKRSIILVGCWQARNVGNTH